MSMFKEQYMLGNGYTKFIDKLRNNSTFFKKVEMDGDRIKYTLEIYEYDFSRFMENNQTMLKYETEMTVQQKDETFLRITFNVPYDQTLEWIENKCEDIFRLNECITYEVSK